VIAEARSTHIESMLDKSVVGHTMASAVEEKSRTFRARTKEAALAVPSGNPMRRQAARLASLLSIANHGVRTFNLAAAFEWKRIGIVCDRKPVQRQV
jgi:hypothetical protein